jgi:hypothetical protein
MVGSAAGARGTDTFLTRSATCPMTLPTFVTSPIDFLLLQLPLALLWPRGDGANPSTSLNLALGKKKKAT